MSYGSRLLFTEVSLILSGKNRYGLVGANGTGKSTFLRLLCQEEEPADGTMSIPKGARIGWLKQDQFRYEHDLVLNVVLQGKKALWSAMQAKLELLNQKEPLTEEQGYKLSELEEIIAENDGYSAESFAEQLLIGLGIKLEQQYEPLSALSGGFKLRVLLAQALFDDPDILILDEPNNYLDMSSIKWLEDYLINEYQGLLIFTSHDQDFLNNTATNILDIDYGEIRAYSGNYNFFIKQKELVMEQKVKEKEATQKKIDRMKIFIDRFKASAARSKQAMSKQKMVDKMELPDIQRSSRISPNFEFSCKRASGKQVVTVTDINKSFGDKVVLKKVNFSVARGEKIAIIGQNGIGKSTLLNIINGKLDADKGTYEWGFETHVSYFAQEHYEMSRDDSTVLEWLEKNITDVPSATIRAALGNVLFKQESVYKKVSVLSGGEITRLLFAKMMLDKGNVLILDEPTNHLDIETRNGLAQALHTYDGTVLLVSHDRHFVTQIATRVIALTQQGMSDFQGNYTEYAAQGVDHLSKNKKK